MAKARDERFKHAQAQAHTEIKKNTRTEKSGSCHQQLECCPHKYQIAFFKLYNACAAAAFEFFVAEAIVKSNKFQTRKTTTTPTKNATRIQQFSNKCHRCCCFVKKCTTQPSLSLSILPSFNLWLEMQFSILFSLGKRCIFFDRRYCRLFRKM